MKYYKLRPDLFGRRWAYGTIYADCNRYDHSIKDAYCPLCNRPVAPSKWIGPYRIYLSSKKVPDMVFGSCPMLVSARVKDAFIESGLLGIIAFEPIEVFLGGKPVNSPFYRIDINYSQKKIALAKELNEARKNDKTLPKCSLCKSGNEPRTQFAEVYLDGERELDIFRIYEKPGQIYCNQVFYDFCQDHGFTNIIEWMEEIKL